MQLTSGRIAAIRQEAQSLTTIGKMIDELLTEREEREKQWAGCPDPWENWKEYAMMLIDADEKAVAEFAAMLIRAESLEKALEAVRGRVKEEAQKAFPAIVARDTYDDGFFFGIMAGKKQFAIDLRAILTKKASDQ